MTVDQPVRLGSARRPCSGRGVSAGRGTTCAEAPSPCASSHTAAGLRSRQCASRSLGHVCSLRNRRRDEAGERVTWGVVRRGRPPIQADRRRGEHAGVDQANQGVDAPLGGYRCRSNRTLDGDLFVSNFRCGLRGLGKGDDDVERDGVLQPGEPRHALRQVSG